MAVQETWQVVHQRGVRWSQVAIACRLNRWPGWQRRVVRYGDSADTCFKTAYGLAGDELAKVAIACDWAIDHWRRTDPDNPTRQKQIVGWLEDQLATLLRPENTATREELRHIAHQTAICLDFIARVEGYIGEARHEARERFVEEINNGNCPDNGRAYRSFLCAQALAGDSKENRRYWAGVAMKSAKRHNDQRGKVRARAILWFGQRGENMLRRLQYPFA